MRKRSARRNLIALNVVLLAVLAVVTIAPDVGASADQPARSRGRYTMVSGVITGLTADCIYILDSANQELVALSWDRTRNRLEPLGYRSLADDAQKQQQPR